ncbi:hypothetical protein ABID76_000267 [Burkholderia ambifaria]
MVSPASMPNAGHGHDAIVVQHGQAVHRAHELHVGAVRALVGHELRDRQLRERFVERCLQAVGERRAGCRVIDEERFGLAVLRALEIGDRQVRVTERRELLRERGRRLAFGVERDRDGQDLFADLLFRRDGAHVLHDDGEAARRGVAFEHEFAFDEVARREALRETFGECVAEAREGLRRQLFGQQFDEQGGGMVMRHVWNKSRLVSPDRSCVRP